MSIKDTNQGGIMHLRRALHVDRFMVAVHEVAPEVYDMLLQSGYEEVVRLEHTELWTRQVKDLTAFDEAASFLSALTKWQDVNHLHSEQIASYVWHMLQQWHHVSDTCGKPVSYLDALYPDEPVRPVKLPPEIKSGSDLVASLIERSKPRFDGDVAKYTEESEGHTRLLKAITKLAQRIEESGITASDVQRLAKTEWRKRSARKKEPSQYRWLVAYQCPRKRLREIAAEFDLGVKADDELYSNLRRTAKQVGLTLRRADN